MRHGRPVVAFDVGGISDWLVNEKTGYIVPEQDVLGFSKALEKLLTNTSLASTMGKNAAHRVREHFVFESYLDTIECFLKGKHPQENP